jgi:ArsR family transcriptional regulator
VRQLSRWFKALSEELRLEILALLLRHATLCVCEVESLLELSQSTASRHLRYLQNAGLVDSRREGLWVYYRLAEPESDQHRRLVELLEPMLGEIPLPDLSAELAAMRETRGCPAAEDRGLVASVDGERRDQQQ